MSISPEAIQAMSSRLTAAYVGSSVQANIVTPNDARSALIGGATIVEPNTGLSPHFSENAQWDTPSLW